MFNNVYYQKKILLTGNTGFKGSWMSLWLKLLGAEVVGLSINVPSQPSLYEELKMDSFVKQYFVDIQDFPRLKEIIQTEKPDFIFHFAAQAIVSLSYKEPEKTLLTNAIGTMNLLEALKTLENSCVAILITSDKCYENIETIWGYKENDLLGGKDIYSASKACAEIIFHSYYASFLKDKANLTLASARAGNVIGGGDWTQDRVIVDCIRSWHKKHPVHIRNPYSTRPWQHVLEPLSGYLTLGMNLTASKKLNGESFNFGPRAEQNHTVQEVLVNLYSYWEDKLTEGNTIFTHTHSPFYEAGLLKLNCDKALFYLNWTATLDYNKTLQFVGEWYNNYYNHKEINIYTFTLQQIQDYISCAKEQGISWCS